MIEKGDKMELDDQFNDAFEYLEFCLEEIQYDIQQLNVKTKYLDECIKRNELNLSILIDSNETNANLFSPTRKAKNGNEFEILKEEKKKNEQELENSIIKLKALQERKEKFENVIYCLQESYSNKKYHIYDDKAIDLNKIDTNGYEDSNINLYSNNKLSIGIDVLETQEKERKRIARDLHDTTVQNMTNIMQKTELCTRLIDIDTIRAKLELQTMIKTIKATINDMRNIIYNLRPMSIDDLGLVPTVERYIKDYNNSNLQIILNVTNEVKDILSIISLSLFRIVQEAINNSIKHGKATRIIIDLKYTDSSIYLTISDNGIGFKIDDGIGVETNILSGFGLSIMKERVLLLSGDFNMLSDEKDGTKIFVRVPLKVQKEDFEWNR